MDTVRNGNQRPMRPTEPMKGRVRVQDTKPGMRVVWGGRNVRLTEVVRRDATRFIVRAEGGLEAEMAGTAVLKLAPAPTPVA